MAQQHRIIVVGLVWNKNKELLFCKMAPDRGVFPNQWGFPGGAIEHGEKMTDALERELKEELDIDIKDIKPAFFKDGSYEKTFSDGSQKLVYMIFLLFHCTATSEKLNLNEEFSDYKWVKIEKFSKLELNKETIDTLNKLGYL